MTSIAVVAHARKTLGDGLPALRRALTDQGFADPIWHEVRKSKEAPARVEKALDAGADLVFAWGGDGTVQRCIDAMAGTTDTTLAILPAGTANLLATNLGIPIDLDRAVEIGLHGDRRRIDTGTVNGEHFAVMAGCGFDARMIKAADGDLKQRFGRAAYLWTGAKHLRVRAVPGRVRIDREDWFEGDLSCVLVGNVGSLFANLTVFEGARPDDGRLDVGVVTAHGVTTWIRALSRVVGGHPDRSPFVQTTVARRIDVRLDRRVPYELDGGGRKSTKRLKIKVHPDAITVAVPSSRAS
jgi:diacylglycerol kinase (ATP)